MTGPGLYDAITDVPGIQVGHYSSPSRGTGCTVVIARNGACPGVFQPGGAPGTLDTELANPANSVQEAHAILLSGGSVFGIEASTGARRKLREQGVGLRVAPDQPPLPIVMGAVVFDRMVGGVHNPDAPNGRSAVENASIEGVAQGSVGVGTGCTVAKLGPPDTALKGGVGTASLQHESGLIVGALVAVNCVGDILNPHTGELIAGARGRRPGEMLRATDHFLHQSRAEFEAAYLQRQQGSLPLPDQAGANTTLCVIATNAKLHKGTAQRVAIMASAGLARTIHPVFTPGDGDTIFTLATGIIDVKEPPALLTLTGTMAAEATATAVLRAVHTADSLAGVPSVTDWTGPRRKTTGIPLE